MADLGSDIAGVRDITPTLSIVRGRRALGQAILRRLVQKRGGLLGHRSYGYDLQDQIGSPVHLQAVESLARQQVDTEEEVERSDVRASFANHRLSVAIDVLSSNGPFEFTLSVGEDLTIEAFLDGELFLREAT